MRGRNIELLTWCAPLLAVLLSGGWFVLGLALRADPFLIFLPFAAASLAMIVASWSGSAIGAGATYTISTVFMLGIAVLASASIGWFLLPAVILEAIAGALAFTGLLRRVSRTSGVHL